MILFGLPMNSWLLVISYFLLLFALARPLGAYMAKVYEGERTFLTPALGWIESKFFALSGIDPVKQMDWKEYALSLLVFSFVCFVGLFLILLCQSHLPLNPSNFHDISVDMAFNAAASIITNTGWQSHLPESSISQFSQLAGITVNNFFSCAAGMAVMVAFVRGFIRTKTTALGNFWADLVRGILYILLPLATALAIILSSQGVVQTLTNTETAQWLDPTVQTGAAQIIHLGPASSLVAIKQLSSTGAGYYNVNSAHPFENPTPLSNFFEMLAILLIPVAQFFMFGAMVRNMAQGWSLIIAISLVFLPMTMFALAHEQAGNPLLPSLGIEQSVSAHNPGGNMEGKEMRIGIAGSVLWASATTATSNGSVNASFDSFLPLTSAVPLMLMQFDEAIFGGAGSGLFSMLILVVITVFIAGLMAGRTPEYLGKSVQTYEIKMATLAMLVPHLVSLIGAAVAMSVAAGKAGVFNPGAQGFSEILYAFTSAANTNGSAMAGLFTETPFYNISLALAMLAGRFLVIIPVLAIAGSLAQKQIIPQKAGTLSTTSSSFVLALLSIVLLVGVLAFVPTLALGPIAEHFHVLGSAYPQ